jgi:hypothetical protein
MKTGEMFLYELKKRFGFPLHTTSKKPNHGTRPNPSLQLSTRFRPSFPPLLAGSVAGHRRRGREEPGKESGISTGKLRESV